MYTGIVQAHVPITKATRNPGHLALEIEFPPDLVTDLKIGGSVAIEGVCMSATAINGTTVSFDAMDATLERTNIGHFDVGDRVNIERSAKMNDETGGHVVAGHVSCTAELVEITTGEKDAKIRFRVPEQWAKYVFPRGFLAVNGCSLTVAEADGDIFTIYLIPETLRQTTFGNYKVGDHINIEVDHQTMITVDVMERTLERLLPQQLSGQQAA